MARALVTGASGFIGSYVLRALLDAGWEVVAWHGAHPERMGLNGSPRGLIGAANVDLARPDDIDAALAALEVDAVAHTGAMSQVGDCQRDPDRAHRINVDATARLAAHCAARHARLIHFSTDQIFDGRTAWVKESAPPAPIHAYGESKAAAERAVAESGADACIARISLVYGDSPTRVRSATEQVLRPLERGERLGRFVDEFRTPLLVHDVASAVIELLEMSEPPRVLNLAGPDRISRYEFGRETAAAYGFDPEMIEEDSIANFDASTPRAPDLSLDTALARRTLRRPPRSVREGLAWLASESRKGAAS
ncbi:MAG: SDR family oxidoreductase [Planctomycetota bacterium]|nr:SDR family oxidoreductase [Planctomycetota bacterium]